MSESAFEDYGEYFSESRPRLVGEAYCLTGDIDAAQAIARDVLIRAYVRWPELCKDERPLVWESRQVRDLAATAAGSASPTRRAESRADLSAEQAAVRRASFALAPGERESLVFYEVAGLTTDELADVLGLSEEKVTTRLAAARSQLAEALARADAGDRASSVTDDDAVGEGLRDLASFAGSRMWLFSPVDARRSGRLRRTARDATHGKSAFVLGAAVLVVIGGAVAAVLASSGPSKPADGHVVGVLEQADGAPIAGTVIVARAPKSHALPPLGGSVSPLAVVATVSVPHGRWHLSLPPGFYEAGDQPTGLRVEEPGGTVAVGFDDPEAGLTWVLFDVTPGGTVTVYNRLPAGTAVRAG